ncbi:MAG: toxic anion resistance protein, partial [Clostridiales bacterium]|nr:toxic anion resistance protein [Clostridiales bacterium]
MSDENMQAEPVLTLEPVQGPVLTLGDLDPNNAPALPTIPVKEYSEAVTENMQLTPAEQKQVDDFAQSIDIHNSAIILQYGSSAQTKMGNFSESALSGVRSKDMGEIGGTLTGLVTQLKSFDVTEDKGKGAFGFFKKGANKVTALKARYTSVEKNVDQIAGALEKHQITLLKDITLLDKMYDQNLIYFKEITMYILAGKQKLNDVETNELPALRAKAQASGLPEDAQAANDLANQCDRFSKNVHDLELTRT